MVEEIYADLNGRDTGIVVQLVSVVNGKVSKRFVRRTLPNGVKNDRLFSTIELAKVCGKSFVDSNVEIVGYNLFVHTKEVTVPLSDAFVRGSMINFFSTDATGKTTHYHMKQIREGKVVNIGYFVFRHADIEQYPKEESLTDTNQNKYFEYVKDAINAYMMHSSINHDDIVLDKVSYEGREYKYHIKGTTANIHILENSKIMDINQNRKSYGSNCIPFDSKMDKYATIFVYAECELHEPNVISSEAKTGTLISKIVDVMKDASYEYGDEDINAEEIKFVPVKFDCLVRV